jgi:hypothetical protein
MDAKIEGQAEGKRASSAIHFSHLVISGKPVIVYRI